jgi:hypothetical protein
MAKEESVVGALAVKVSFIVTDWPTTVAGKERFVPATAGAEEGNVPNPSTEPSFVPT